MDKRVICTDIYDKEGNLTHIEAHSLDGEFVIQAVWDTNDKQTSKNREHFRKWFYRHLQQTGYEPQ